MLCDMELVELCGCALAVQLDGSCCWVGLESGELMVCRWAVVCHGVAVLQHIL
jgi:hypothetical protein